MLKMMCSVKEKIKLKKLSGPIKFGNVWEHSFHGEDAGDIISVKIYTKTPILNSNGFGIIYIIERFVQSDHQSSEDILGSLFGWVEISKGDYFHQYEIMETSS
ncbi:hypothetical protein ICN10_00045 [Polynucleobacter sp. 86C-FISCH]|uniref:hypothetical protein n=1 Tax=Polynucleobacter sp. 86C-FISCH TaxID=2689101 RepID=UPI001C0E041A|nr:hypothetical protein [Polynucleobacter sp. 86C-FISCH]MBU3594789.1 hypothetical protein [Polynucleobacter sp. 86C-FISCH]